jgi:hypothetical protein
MRKYIGFFLLCAGLSFGAFAFYPSAIDQESRLAEITAILAAPAGEMTWRSPETTGSIRSFAPRHEMTIEPRRAGKPVSGETVVAMTPPPATSQAAPQPLPSPPPAAQVAAPQAAATSGWQAIVTPDPGSVPSGVTSSKPGDGHARYELVVDLQRELKRAGCYGGTLSGSWNAMTKRAMSAFMERANATLPMEEPDYILLTLLKGHASATCVTCPMGQKLSDGRCVPNPIIAQNNPQKKPAKPQDSRVAAAAKAPESSWKTTVAEAETRALAPADAPPAPLPGRMAVGAAVPEPATRATAAPAEAWRLNLVPSPSATKPALSAPSTMPPAKIAALEADDDGQDVSGAADAAAASAAGLPGSKSGLAVSTPGANFAPSPTIRPVYNAPSPRPRASAARPRASAKPQRTARRSGTRSVQSLFMHPLGRM